MILSGIKVRDDRLKKLKDDFNNIKGIISLAIIYIGDNKSSEIYINNKKKMADILGINIKVFKYDIECLESDIIDKIIELNNDNNIYGIMVQLPIPLSLNKEKIINSIDYRKDIDGLTNKNMLNLTNNKLSFIPSTVFGILNLFDYYNINLFNKKIVILNKSNLIGIPLEKLLKNRNLDVISCNSKTKDLDLLIKNADILIVAIGKAKYIKRNMIKENSTIIDVGINKINNIIYGDVDFDNVVDICDITPVPGGIGPMTVISLFENLYKSYMLKKENKW